MVSPTIIERYGSPNILDQSPYGTVCKVSNHNKDTYDIYVQVSADEESPEWEHLGYFTNVHTQEFINDIINERINKNVHYG